MAFEDGEIRTVTVLDHLPQAPRRGGRKLKDQWLLVFDAGWEALAGADLTVTDHRVFAALASRSTIGSGEWELRAPVVAEQLGIDVRRVYRSVEHLVEAGLIARTRKGFIEFNPDLFWRGSAKSRVERRNTGEAADG